MKIKNLMLIICSILLTVLPACNSGDNPESILSSVEQISQEEGIPMKIDKSFKLEYKTAPAGNPLKGLIPFKGVFSSPHSMEWYYIPMDEVMNGYNSFTWETGLEPILEEISTRGNHAAIRIYIDYPGSPIRLPDFLKEDGVKLFDYTAFGGGQNPDYSDENLIRALKNLIADFGRKYDGDPRIGFITCGLIGHWGEWHTYPDENMMPSVQIQNELFELYDKSFSKTRLLARYPNSGNLPEYNIGYHDDSFAFSTLEESFEIKNPGVDPRYNWHFMALMNKAGVKALDKWKSEPIGGEISPDLQKSLFDIPRSEEIEDFEKCVQTTHASWMMAHNIFTKYFPGTDEYDRAFEASSKMGYDYFIGKSYIDGIDESGNLNIKFNIGNKGVAPFYYDWVLTAAIADSEMNILTSWDIDFKFSGILPGEYRECVTSGGNLRLDSGEYTVLLKVNNPLILGKIFRFSNVEQDKNIKGWLSLGNFLIP